MRLVFIQTMPHQKRGKYGGGTLGPQSDGVIRIATNRLDVEIQAYCAIIACLLIALWTGKKPTKQTFEMIGFYFIGWADEEELLAHLAKLKEPTA